MTTTIRGQETMPRTARHHAPFILALLAAALFITGCGPTLVAVTAPPPMRVARLESHQPLFAKRKHQARVSQGVALAFKCVHGGPCRDVRATIDDPTIVKVVPAHLAELQPDPMAVDHTPASTLLLVGLQPGETVVHLRTRTGRTKVRVTVVE